MSISLFFFALICCFYARNWMFNSFFLVSLLTSIKTGQQFSSVNSIMCQMTIQCVVWSKEESNKLNELNWTIHNLCTYYCHVQCSFWVFVYVCVPMWISLFSLLQKAKINKNKNKNKIIRKNDIHIPRHLLHTNDSFAKKKPNNIPW